MSGPSYQGLHRLNRGFRLIGYITRSYKGSLANKELSIVGSDFFTSRIREPEN